MAKVNVTPNTAQPLGQYGNTGNPVAESAALCQQMSDIQRSINTLITNGRELQDASRQMLKSMQTQHQNINRLLARVDKASQDADTSIERITEAAATMEA